MRIAVPNKGRLHEPTIDLLERAGLHLENGAERKLYAETVDPDVTVLFARAADIPEYIADGAADVGITGLDQVRESGHAGGENENENENEIVDLLDLEFGRCRLVLAAPEDGDITSIPDLEGKTVATEFPTITRRFFENTGVDPEVVEVTGATELTPHVEMADAIVDITSTGTTLKVNRLAILEEVLSSSVRLFARADVREDAKVREVRTALASVLAADGKRYLMMNVPRERLDEIREVIPGLGGPTIMDIANDGEPEDSPSGQDATCSADGRGEKVAVHAVVDERDVFETITEVKRRGASGILVTEIERLVE